MEKKESPSTKALKYISNYWTPHSGQKEVIGPVLKDKLPFVYVECGRKFGKALELSEVLPTPLGFKKVSDIEVGDEIFGPDGKTTTVINATEVQSGEYYNIRLCDGTCIKACANHRWSVKTKSDRKHGYSNRILTTVQLLEHGIMTRAKKAEFNFSIDSISPVEYSPNLDLEVDPYLLGLWLGDGSSHGGQFSTLDLELLVSFEEGGYRISHQKRDCDHYVSGLVTQLSEIKVLKNKHIPEDYLLGSVEQRLALLQGLMDSDGYCNVRGHCRFYNTNKDLINGVAEIVRSLGYKCKVRLKTTSHKDCYSVEFQTNPAVHPAFRLERKLERQRAPGKPQHRFIVDIEYIGIKEGRCFEVDNSDHMYLCSRSYVPTHNTEFSVWMCWVHALTVPNAEVYYLAPAVKQAKELVWANGRMQSCNTYKSEFLETMKDILGGEIKIYNHEMRVVLPNGSFIKVDGSDNYNMHRGLKPDFVVADEYRDFKAGWIEAVRPNMLVKKSTILFVTTPPHTYNHAYYMAEDCRQNTDGQHFYLNLPTITNDKIPDLEAWLEGEKARLFRNDRHDEWYREYEAKFVESSQSHILPGFSKSFMTSHEKVEKDWVQDFGRHDQKYLKPSIIVSFGNTTVLGAILVYYNPRRGKVVILESAYTDQPIKTYFETLLKWIEEWGLKYNINQFTNIEFVNSDSSNMMLFNDYTGLNSYFVDINSNLFYCISSIKELVKLNNIIVSDSCDDLVKQTQNFVVVGDTRGIPDTVPPLVECLLAIPEVFNIEPLREKLNDDSPNSDLTAIYGDPEKDRENLLDKWLDISENLDINVDDF